MCDYSIHVRNVYTSKTFFEKQSPIKTSTKDQCLSAHVVNIYPHTLLVGWVFHC